MKRQFLSRIIFATIFSLMLCQSCEKEKGHLGLPKDGDGNTYDTVVIGTQTWLAENLKTTKFNNGGTIKLITDNTEWNEYTLPAYSWYNNDHNTYKDSFGALYNWYAGSLKLLCPDGYHVPSKDEWETLANNLINASETVKQSFKAIYVGWRTAGDGSFSQGLNGSWWVSAPIDHDDIVYRVGLDFAIGTMHKKAGFSVRCIKD
jgi:hypothetical protein